jgi:hypothetical protein
MRRMPQQRATFRQTQPLTLPDNNRRVPSTLQSGFARATVLYILDTLRQCVLQRKCACDRPQNTAVHQRNRSAFKRADVRLCRFSARAGGRFGGHFCVPYDHSQAIAPALASSCGRRVGQVFCNVTADMRFARVWQQWTTCGYSTLPTDDRTVVDIFGGCSI